MTELWLYEGEPTDIEMLHRDAERVRTQDDDHLLITIKCPACGGRDTRWVRNQWHICFHCVLAYTTDEANERFFDLTIDEEFED